MKRFRSTSSFKSTFRTYYICHINLYNKCRLHITFIHIRSLPSFDNYRICFFQIEELIQAASIYFLYLYWIFLLRAKVLKKVMESTDGFPIPQHSVSKIKYSRLIWKHIHLTMVSIWGWPCRNPLGPWKLIVLVSLSYQSNTEFNVQ